MDLVLLLVLLMQAWSLDAVSDLPQLPAAGEAEPGTTRVTVGGGKVTLEHLGPGIVGRDGTLSRIANWAELSEGERATAFRVIAKRNQERLLKLREAEAAIAAAIAADPSLAAAAALTSAQEQAQLKIPLQLTDGNISAAESEANDCSADSSSQTAPGSDAQIAAQQCKTTE